LLRSRCLLPPPPVSPYSRSARVPPRLPRSPD
jgi:hypothetical protein